MGKTEKLVVLSVLFLVVVLFVWSLQGGDGTKGGAGGAVYGSETNQTTPPDGQAGTGAGSTTRRGAGAAEGQAPGGRSVAPTGSGSEVPVLDGTRGDQDTQVAGGDPLKPGPTGEAAPKLLFAEKGMSSGSRPGPVRMQPGWDLVTTAGLVATVDPTMFVLQPSGGATWESLARDLYGDEGKAELLRHNNEGMTTPGRSIFVPAKDDLGRAAQVRVVEVLKGESLWGVATRTLGNGARWKEIHEANLDVIPDPNFISPGTRLRIPE